MRLKGGQEGPTAETRSPWHPVRVQSASQAVQLSCRRRRRRLAPGARGRWPVLLVETEPIVSDKLELCRLTTTAPAAALEQSSGSTRIARLFVRATTAALAQAVHSAR